MMRTKYQFQFDGCAGALEYMWSIMEDHVSFFVGRMLRAVEQRSPNWNYTRQARGRSVLAERIAVDRDGHRFPELRV